MIAKVGQRTPNEEQLVAIAHNGGKILSAGAGSGKTFVLIEHIIHLLDQFKKSHPKEEWRHKLSFKLSRIVLMTFTKKSAGEMSVRMLRRVDELCENSEEDKAFWLLVRNYLSMLKIATIDSFCKQIIAQGHFPELGSSVEIVSSIEQKNKISILFNEWFDKRKPSLDQVFLANVGALVRAMEEIFSSNELRLLWKKPIHKTNAFDELNLFFDRFIIKNDFNFLFDGSYKFNLGLDDKEKAKVWYKLYQDFYLLTQKLGPLCGKNFKDYAFWCENAGRMHSTPKTLNAEDQAYFELAKTFMRALKSYSDDFNAFIDHYETYWNWAHTIKDAFLYIDEHYLEKRGFSFADLEYYVCLGLRDETVLNAVKKNYDYFIVDEFQDTSSTQFEILMKLVGSDHSRLFCVGDKKQAIYRFRGGELQVFNECSEILGEENNIALRKNFRSYSEVIDFNNNFFELIFPLGIDFEGRDEHGVHMEKQIAPKNNLGAGSIVKIEAHVIGVSDSKVKLNADFYEAKALRHEILELLKRDDIQSICVLYTRLKPSSFLIELLSEAQVSYKAQIKVAYGDDPIINLFLSVNELILNQSNPDKLRSTHYLLRLLLDVIGVQLDTKILEKKFMEDLPILGLRLSFHKLVFSLGVSNSLYVENSKLIDSICKVCDEEPVAVYGLLSAESDQSYSMTIMSGNSQKKVLIMTAHASKGLEFDAVLVGGIHTNGSQMPNRDVIGKMPRSFRWKKVYNQKKFFKTPVHYEEVELGKMKDFSESKRLLYVACTRAIKQLTWIELTTEFDGKISFLDKNEKSWIKAFRLGEHLPHRLKSLILPCETFSSNEISPLMKDNLGLVSNKKMGRVGVFAETSVTKLSTIAECPFKFYLTNICKITPIGSKISFINEPEEEGELFYSSMERGTRIHATLSELLCERISIDEVGFDERDKIEWAYSESLKFKKSNKVISEKLIKFSFFDQMISGTPDLVFDGDDDFSVWDFKTGQRHESNENGYWFQLMCYGYAYAKLKCFAPEKMISLTLLYVDQKKLITKELSFREISHFLFESWLKTESLNQVNLNHCHYCEYSPLCVYYKSSAP